MQPASQHCWLVLVLPHGARVGTPNEGDEMVTAITGSPLRKHLRPFGGQSIVEFAFVSLTLLMLIFGIIDLGRAVFSRSMLTGAVREAARYASIKPADNAGILAAAQRTSPTLGLTSITVTCYYWNTAATPSPAWAAYAGVSGANCATAQSGDRLILEAAYTFGLTAPRLIGFSTIPMNESARVSVQ